MLLAKDGVDPDFKYNDDWTPLLWATRNGYEVVVELLQSRNGAHS